MTTTPRDCSHCMGTGTVTPLVWIQWYQAQANLDRDVNMYDWKREHPVPVNPDKLQCYVCKGTGIQYYLDLIGLS